MAAGGIGGGAPAPGPLGIAAMMVPGSSGRLVVLPIGICEVVSMALLPLVESGLVRAHDLRFAKHPIFRRHRPITGFLR